LWKRTCISRNVPFKCTAAQGSANGTRIERDHRSVVFVASFPATSRASYGMHAQIGTSLRRHTGASPQRLLRNCQMARPATPCTTGCAARTRARIVGGAASLPSALRRSQCTRSNRKLRRTWRNTCDKGHRTTKRGRQDRNSYRRAVAGPLMRPMPVHGSQPGAAA
jgi:hypothetical protein